MASDWEDTFTRWTKPPSDTEDERCVNAESMIKKAIAANKKLSQMNIEVFAQGSYANNTNIRLNSDVDICVRNMDTFFPYYPDGMTDSDAGHVDSDYKFPTFKNDVETALVDYFGRGQVKRGNKAFDIKSNTYRIEADVVPTFEYRRYTGEKDSYGNYYYHSGTKFFPDNGDAIINWPHQNKSNGIHKNKNTALQFKKVVRILKKLNLEMGGDGVVVSKKIPSFLIECLCWNVDNSVYDVTTYTAMVRNSLSGLYHATNEYENVKEWGEINELKYLFRASQPWKRGDVNLWTAEAWNYLGFNE
jgi:hypothetical protein